ncbi:MAG: DUF4435 domain-containing protein [Pseudanabaena sp. CAN_BIN31]|jgi:hypothetical protein|nr:DUF4435 domain-containing protein [Pseudanabaena sp. CAN_BIN31]
MSKGRELSEQEIIDLIREEKSILTILVEGKDDASVYRYLEDRINETINISSDDVDVFKCGGRTTLINLFKRRQEFKNARVVFVADKDMWFFVGIPAEYDNEIVFTDGYSLENDLYIESHFNSLLTRKEKADFFNLIQCLSIWFAFEVNKYKQDGVCKLNVSIDEVCPNGTLCNEFKQNINFIQPTQEIIDMICLDYTRALRGKQLFDALIKFVSPHKKKRETKYSRLHLLEMGAKFPNPRIDLLVKSIVDKFKEYD